MWVRPLTLKRIVISLIATLIGLTLGYTGYTLRANQLRLRLELHHTQQQKIELDSKLNEQVQKTQELEKVRDDLQIQLQTKKQQQMVLASVRRVQAPAVVFSGDCASWMTQAGITDVASASVLIRKESGCNPYAVNRSSGACGVAQELPCGKSGCQLGDGACQVRWMNHYVTVRYGSWYNALQFHLRNSWY